MSIAPLHGRPAPLLFVRQKPREDWPHYRPADLRAAPLTSRARRRRRRRLWMVTLGTVAALLVMSVVAWAVLNWRG
jgi:uncharacterized membrane protein YcjF (UPF0283 family)